ncbi:MAG: nuclear transport factor 2 family protein [Hyphomonas sp.]|nr:nuclear transport factor 2 family protein [Hyphomonas sp.]
MKQILPAALVALAAGCQSPAPETNALTGTGYGLTAGPTATPELKAAVLKADTDLFAAVFDACDADLAGTMMTEDVHFLHDKWGEIATTRDALVEAFRASCDRQAAGTDFRARRERVDDTIEVHALSGYGALETGVHRFYALLPGEAPKLTETGRFLIVWKQDGDTLRMAETISYDHSLAE